MTTATIRQRSGLPAPTADRRRRWSRRRRVLSAVVVVVVVVAAGLFAWRASRSPLQLWTGSSQCAAAPDGTVGSLFGLAISSDLRGASGITVLDIEAPGSEGARSPRFWVVPVTNGSGGTGSASTAQPPPHWAERVPATGATMRADRPANLLASCDPGSGTRCSARCA